MSLLKRLGGILLKVGEYAIGIEHLMPAPPAALDKGIATLNQIAGIVIQVEAIGQTFAMAGADKLKAAAPLVADVILRSDVLVGRKIKDQALFSKAAGELAGAVADILNSLEDNVDTKSLT